MSRGEEEKMVERIRSDYRPDELTPATRRALYAAIESRISPKPGSSSLWVPAFAGVALTAVVAFLVSGSGSRDLPVELPRETALTDELLLGSELLEERSAVPLTEEFDAIDAVFLAG